MTADPFDQWSRDDLIRYIAKVEKASARQTASTIRYVERTDALVDRLWRLAEPFVRRNQRARADAEALRVELQQLRDEGLSAAGVVARKRGKVSLRTVKRRTSAKK